PSSLLEHAHVVDVHRHRLRVVDAVAPRPLATHGKIEDDLSGARGQALAVDPEITLARGQLALDVRAHSVGCPLAADLYPHAAQAGRSVEVIHLRSKVRADVSELFCS